VIVDIKINVATPLCYSGSLNIGKENNDLYATYDWFAQWGRFIGVPVENIRYSGDSLIFDIFYYNIKYNYNGKYDDKLKTFGGVLESAKWGRAFSLDFGREPVESWKKQKNIYQGLRKDPTFSRQDSLRGSITLEREWWDLRYYHLNIKVNLKDSTIQGSNTIYYKVLKPNEKMQIDLQPPLTISKVLQDDEELKIIRDSNVYYIVLKRQQEPGTLNNVTIHYSGKLPFAKDPPWDGGFSWEQDSLGKPFIATSCQGIGASIWWPNKDHMYDEVDSMLISVNVPDGLVGVANGRLRDVDNLKDGTQTYHWFVSNPINNYGVNVNIADYVHFSEKYKGANGLLDCEYYVLKENYEKAKNHFKQVPLMLKAFEYWFGPYPFYEDAYKLVEVSYLGMEHQSSVTYGNQYKNGILGVDYTGTGWGLKFDYIIIHESAHEWFANNITYKDIADMWIHEGFATYSESLYLEYHFGISSAEEYIQGLRKMIAHDKPMIGTYDVNHEGSGDMYSKGANILHTLRQIVNDDNKWRKILRGLNRDFYHSTVTTKEIEDYLSEKAGIDLTSFFNQYLRSIQIPILEYYFTEKELVYRWINTVSDFEMPVIIYLDGSEKRIHPKTIWTLEHIKVKSKELKIDPNFYVSSFNIKQN